MGDSTDNALLAQFKSRVCVDSARVSAAENHGSFRLNNQIMVIYVAFSEQNTHRPVLTLE